jgi:Ras-related protein Rab-5C
MNTTIRYKCVLLGSYNSGKTSIINQIINNKFQVYTTSTVGALYSAKILPTSKGNVQLDIWDTAGQDRYDSIVPMYYRGADYIVIVYDITNLASFEKAKKWVNIIQSSDLDNYMIILVGNKIDLANDRVIQYDEAKLYANSMENILLFLECSAKTAENVSKIITSIISDISIPTDNEFDTITNTNSWSNKISVVLNSVPNYTSNCIC